MIPNPKRKDLRWLNILNTYETCQWQMLNIVKRGISLTELKRGTRKWMQKVGLVRKRPFYLGG